MPGKIAALMAALCLVGPAVAAAEVGDLTQPPGPESCFNALGRGDPNDPGTAGQCTVARALESSDAISLSSDGRNLYALSGEREAVAVFDRDPATGALSQKSGPAGCVTETGRSDPGDPTTAGQCTDIRGMNDTCCPEMEIAPDGRNLYLEGTGTLIILDREPSTGVLSMDPGTAGCLSNTGRSDPFDAGTAGECQAVPDSSFADDFAITGSHLYLPTSDGITLYDRNGSGDLTKRPGPAACIADDPPPGTCVDGRGVNAEDLELSADGTRLYVGSQGNVVSVLSRDPVTGLLSQDASPAACISVSGESDPGNPATAGECRMGRGMWRVYGLALSADGRSLYSAASDSDGIAAYDVASPGGAFEQQTGIAGCVTETGQGNASDPATAGQCRDGKVLADARGVEVSPDGLSVYAAGSLGIANFDRNPLTRALSQSPDPTGCVTVDGLANPLDPATAGQCTAARAAEGDEIEISSDGRFAYVAAFSGVGVFRRELAPLCGGARSTVVGTLARDTLRGTRGRDVIAGLGGRDKLIGLGGNDLVCGGKGNDQLQGRGGKDRLLGQAGKDRLLGGTGRDTLRGGKGRDTLRGGKGRDRLLGGPGRDSERQ